MVEIVTARAMFSSIASLIVMACFSLLDGGSFHCGRLQRRIGRLFLLRWLGCSRDGGGGGLDRAGQMMQSLSADRERWPWSPPVGVS